MFDDSALATTAVAGGTEGWSGGVCFTTSPGVSGTEDWAPGVGGAWL